MLGPQTLDQKKGLQARHDGIASSSWKPKLQDEELKTSVNSMLSVRPSRLYCRVRSCLKEKKKKRSLKKEADCKIKKLKLFQSCYSESEVRWHCKSLSAWD